MLNELERILVQLYDSPQKARHVIDRAQIPFERVDMSGSMRAVWHAIIAEAVAQGRLQDVVRIALDDFPQRMELQQIQGALRWQRIKPNTEDAMSDRWGAYGDVARLGERISVLETRLPLIEQAMERRFDELQAGQNSNRAYSEREFGELRTLIKSSTTVKPSSDRLFVGMVVVGALVTAIFILVIALWVYTLTGGRLT